MTMVEEAPGRPPDEADLVTLWREEQLMDLGFDYECAVLLADAPVDLHEAARLIENGCSHHLAFLILY